jgi:hypothetical protein
VIKHPSLLSHGLNYKCKMFNSTGHSLHELKAVSCTIKSFKAWAYPSGDPSNGFARKH